MQEKLPMASFVVRKDEMWAMTDYEEKGSDEAYQQALFKNDPPAKTSVLKVHFPEEVHRKEVMYHKYIFLLFLESACGPVRLLRS